MRILLVEDSDQKAARVISVIEEACPELQVDVVASVMDAVRATEKESFDLLILDLHIPLQKGGNPMPGGGVALVQEVISRTECIPPKSVVALTAFSVEEAGGDSSFNVLDSFVVSQYAEDEDSWERTIRNAIDYQAAVAAHTPTKGYDSDYVIITALADPEHRQVLGQFPELEQVHIAGWSRSAFVGDVSSTSGNKRVIALNIGRMGIPGAATITTQAIEQFRPKSVLMTGICGGVEGNSEIGDLIIPRYVFTNESGKHTTQEGGTTFKPNPEPSFTSDSVCARLSDRWASLKLGSRVLDSWPGDRPLREPRILTGGMACSSAVLQDYAKVESILKQDRKLAGIDMESYGMVFACREASLPAPTPIVLKSVCDLADKDKDDKNQGFCAYFSAYAAKAIVTSDLVWDLLD